MALDPSIPLQARGINGLQVLENGSKIADMWLNQQAEGELSRIYSQSQGDMNKMLELGQQSKLARFIVPQIQAQQAANVKNQLDQQKTFAEIGKTNSEATKNNAQAGGYTLDNSQKLLSSADRALVVAARNGDPMAAKLALSNALKAGAITPELYNQYNGQIDVLSTQPEAFKEFVGSLAISNAKDPDKYLFTTADNQLDNATSRENNQATVNATMRGQDITASTADKNRAQDAQQFSQRQQLDEWLAKNKPIGTEMGNDGYMYAIFPGGKGVRISDERGTPIQAQPKGTGANSTVAAQKEEQQRITRVNTVLDEIEGILPDATASYAGRGVDLVARGIGLATPGDIATGKLGTLGGQLVALMPKMSGPQSDKDVAMYKQMAGQLDDPTVPLQVRQAALKTIRSLNNKYGEMNAQKSVTVPYRNDAPVSMQPQNQAKLNNILFGN